MSDFRAAIAADATYVLAYYNLANVFLAKQQLRQALSLYDKACELLEAAGIEDEDVYNNRAICKVKVVRNSHGLADEHAWLVVGLFFCLLVSAERLLPC